MNVDFGRTSSDYARHRQGFPEEFFSELRLLGFAPSGSSLLDVGSGTGALAIRFASEGARVTALDLSASQLEQADARARELGLDLETLCTDFESNELPARSFDYICAGQCWHWFDGAQASRQLRRLVAPEGRVLICSYDWIPLEGSVVAATEALILEHNPTWHLAGGDGRYPNWETDLLGAGFEVLQHEVRDHEALYTHEGWRGRIRASAGVAASLDAQGVRAFDDAHAALLDEHFPEDPLKVPHRYGYCLAKLPATGCSS